MMAAGVTITDNNDLRPLVTTMLASSQLSLFSGNVEKKNPRTLQPTLLTIVTPYGDTDQGQH